MSLKGQQVIFHEKKLYCLRDFQKNFPEIDIKAVEQEVKTGSKAPETSGESFQELVQHQAEIEGNRPIEWVLTEIELSGLDSEILLYAEDVPGSYFVYKTSTDRSRDYAVVLLTHDHDVRHFRILEKEGLFYLNFRENGFKSIAALALHYRTYPLIQSGLKLGNPLEFPELNTLTISKGKFSEELSFYRKQLAVYQRIKESADKVQSMNAEDTPLHASAKICGLKAKTKDVLRSPD